MNIAALRFRPTFWPTVTAIPMLLLLLALGIWQIQRLHWKEGLIAARSAALAAPTVLLPHDLATARHMEYRHVRAEGEFLHDHEFLLGATDKAGTTGYQVITPLRLDDGAIVLVNRGWIDASLKDPAKRAAGEVKGRVAVEGLLRLPLHGRPNWFVPDNRCDINYWFWVDVPAMAKCGGLAGVLPFYVDAGPAPNPGGWPKGGVTRTELRNEHLQYAITWFTLAVALVVVYVLYHRQRKPSGE